MKREDIVRCNICNCNILTSGKKNLILPYRNTLHMHLMSICICETCYYRFPYGLQCEIKNVADKQNDPFLAGYLLSSIKNIGRSNLNQGIWILHRNIRTGEAQFKKCSCNRSISDAVINLDKQILCTVYRDGKTMNPFEVEDQIYSCRKRLNLVGKKSDLSR